MEVEGVLLIRVNRRGFHDFDMDLFHIIKQFYEDAELDYEASAEKPDLIVTLEVEVEAGGREETLAVKGILEDPQRGQSWTAFHERRVSVPVEQRQEATENSAASLPAAESEGAAIRAILRRKTMKRAVGFALLHLLQDATGLIQPWGTLTGVRPTKLVHNLLRTVGRDECLRILQEQHLVTEEKAKLVTDIAERQLKVIPDLFDLDKEVSVYIGIPFCPTKCAYCTFPAYDIRGNNGSVASFLEGLRYEIRETGRWIREAGLTITTLYWGGGTPTSIEAEEMDELFTEIHEWFPGMKELRELTVEAGRPDTITPEKLAVMQKWNVDRISINPQSFTQATLDTIGRHHTVKETVEKFLLSRDSGMDNINMDLIIGLPGEGTDTFRHTLMQTEKLLPESLTVHTLAFKRASRMTQDKKAYEVAERDEIGEMMGMARDWMEDHGYKPYYMYRQKNMLGNLENVGYSLEDRESLYNILMMEERQTIIGLGCGAVSKIHHPKKPGDDPLEPNKIERFPNPKEPNAYSKGYKEYTEKKLALLQEAYFSGVAR